MGIGTQLGSAHERNSARRCTGSIPSLGQIVEGAIGASRRGGSPSSFGNEAFTTVDGHMLELLSPSVRRVERSGRWSGVAHTLQ